MIAAVLDHLWQSTLVALAAGLLTLAFRRQRAGVRHGLWFAASAKFLLPFAALAALGRMIGPAVRAPMPEAAFIARAAQPFSPTLGAGPPAICRRLRRGDAGGRRMAGVFGRSLGQRPSSRAVRRAQCRRGRGPKCDIAKST